MTHHLVEANYLLTSPKVNLFVIKNVFIDFLRLLIIHVNIKLRSRTYCYFANLRPISIGFVFTLSEVIYNMTRTKQIWTGMPWNLESMLGCRSCFYTKLRAFLFKYAARKKSIIYTHYILRNIFFEQDLRKTLVLFKFTLNHHPFFLEKDVGGLCCIIYIIIV